MAFGSKAAKAAAAKEKGKEAAKAKREEKGKRKSSEVAKDDGDLDDIFTKKPAKAAAASKGEGEGGAAKKQAAGKGPDMEEIKREEEKYKGKKKGGGREIVDGVPVYSLAELEEEMGDSAWDAFMEAAEPGLK